MKSRTQRLKHNILAARQVECDPYWGAYRDFRGIVRRHLASLGAAHSEADIDCYINARGSEMARKVLRLLRKDFNTRATRRLLRRSPIT